MNILNENRGGKRRHDRVLFFSLYFFNELSIKKYKKFNFTFNLGNVDAGESIVRRSPDEPVGRTVFKGNWCSSGSRDGLVPRGPGLLPFGPQRRRSSVFPRQTWRRRKKTECPLASRTTSNERKINNRLKIQASERRHESNACGETKKAKKKKYPKKKEYRIDTEMRDGRRASTKTSDFPGLIRVRSGERNAERQPRRKIKK